MRDWATLEPDEYRLLNKHFTPGRGGHRIRYIVRHHNAGMLSIAGIWQVWQDREASAHYQVDVNGRIGQLVNDWDTAWHAANSVVNAESIGIEHANSGGPGAGWPISDATIREGAKLAGALCHAYGLGRPRFGVNIRDHREFTGTSCPNHLAYGGRYHDQWMRIAQEFYDQLASGKVPGATTKGNVMGLLSGVSAAALNDAKVAAQGAVAAGEDNQVQLRGPRLQGWDVAQLAGVQKARKGGPQGSGTLVELVCTLLVELRELRAAVDKLTAGSSSS